MTEQQKKEHIRRKKVMRDAGIRVPNMDNSWGPWWEQQWQNAITHKKTNAYYGVPSFTNFIDRTWDWITGNTTYQAEPAPIHGTLKATDMSIGAQVRRTLRNWKYFGDPVRDVAFFAMSGPSKAATTTGTIIKAVPKMVKAVPKIIRATPKVVSKLATKEGAKTALKSGVKSGAKFVAKEAPKAATSYLGGYGVDQATRAATGKSWGEWAAYKMSDIAGFHIEPIVGEITNPGYAIGYNYGNFVTNNFSNLGRYTLDNLRPWQYAFNKEQLAGLGKTFLQPFYKTPPTFFTHRPKWYTSRKRTKGSNEFLEARFENEANWARIPESEVPRVHFTRNSNGTVSPTHIHNRATVGKDDFDGPGQTIVEMDDITPGLVGGEHSDYTYLGDDLVGNSLFKYSDRQKLNPQWVISDWVKNKFNLQKGSQVYNLVHRLGGIDLSPALGYKPFTIEFMYGKGFDPNPIQTTDAILIKNAKEAFTNPKP